MLPLITEHSLEISPGVYSRKEIAAGAKFYLQKTVLGLALDYAVLLAPEADTHIELPAPEKSMRRLITGMTDGGVDLEGVLLAPVGIRIPAELNPEIARTSLNIFKHYEMVLGRPLAVAEALNQTGGI